MAICGVGVLVVLVVTRTPALASVVGPVAAPEIDGASVSAGVGLLAAGVMIVRAYSRRK